jgi:hypothetical protein
MNYDLDTKEGMANAVDWTNRALALLRFGGTWIVPRSGTVVTRIGEKSVAVREFIPDPSIKRVLEAAGYTVN